MNRKRSNSFALAAVALIAALMACRWAGLGYEDVSTALTLGLVALVIFVGLRAEAGEQRSGRHLPR
jgi:hypothetical protein